METCDFHGWATKANIKCSDGRTIMKDAFKHNHGMTVPLVWNHKHENPEDVIGHALLENRDEGVYAYCSFNDTEAGQLTKTLVQHKDITRLSIYANQLKQHNGNVMHGEIREVSLVHAGANPGAIIKSVIAHSDDGEPMETADECIICHSDSFELYHADDKKGDTKVADETKKTETSSENEETVEDVFNTLTDKQKMVVYAMVGQALTDDEESEGGKKDMKHNVFDTDVNQQENVLTHADMTNIIAMAKQSNVGSFKEALKIYCTENDILQHSDDGYGVFEDYGVLFPELELLKKGEPETLYKYDQSWVGPALAKIHKSPFSRIRTRHADARLAELKAKGYQKKGDKKTIMNQITMINRETTPQTVYIKDNIHRDDWVDITDFDILAYQWNIMKGTLNETLVISAMVGDGREIDDPDKIKEDNIRPIWKDNDEYTIHYDVDIEAARTKLQGTNTGANFGDEFVYAEAIITAALYSREKFKGTGTPDFYCTPHLVNVMLLARDLNGRRIYDSKADLAKALNCNSIVEVEQFEGLVRTTEDGDQKKLLGLFVNLNDYTFGSTRGGEITKFEDFDMDYNLKKFMLETRLSGSLYRLKSAIALEEPVTEAAG